jgi:chromosome segregation ATPase
MHLKQYPNTIAAKQTELLELRQRISQVKDEIAERESQIDQVIAFDADLKNDTQRKAKRSERVRTDAELIDLAQQLAELDYQREKAEIELTLLLNKFSIAKLEKRQTIAQMETEARLTA